MKTSIFRNYVARPDMCLFPYDPSTGVRGIGRNVELKFEPFAYPMRDHTIKLTLDKLVLTCMGEPISVDIVPTGVNIFTPQMRRGSFERNIYLQLYIPIKSLPQKIFDAIGYNATLYGVDLATILEFSVKGGVLEQEDFENGIFTINKNLGIRRGFEQLSAMGVPLEEQSKLAQIMFEIEEIHFSLHERDAKGNLVIPV